MPLALTNDIFTYYEEFGTGPPLVFVHGGGGALEMWRPQIKAFARRHRVVAYDLRGHGRSDGRGGKYSLMTYAADLKALAEHLELGRFVLVGVSFGGLVAQAYASRWASDLSALVLADTALAPTRGWRARLFKACVPLAAVENLFMGMTPHQFAAFTYWSYRRLHEPARAFLTSSQIAMDRQELRKLLGALWRHRAVDLSGLRVPVLLAVGDEEQAALWRQAALLRRKLPHSRMVVVPRSRHLPNLENPEAFNAALAAFVASVPQLVPPSLAVG